MTKTTFTTNGILILLTMLCLLSVTDFLYAGSKKNQIESNVRKEVMHNPDLIPLKIKLKFTPDKDVYRVGETVKLDITVRIDKNNSSYNAGYKYLISNDCTKLQLTGKDDVWTIESSNLKPNTYITNSNSPQTFSIIFKCLQKHGLVYPIAISRVVDSRSGTYCKEYNNYFDNSVFIVLFNSKTRKEGRVSEPYKTSLKFLEWEESNSGSKNDIYKSPQSKHWPPDPDWNTDTCKMVKNSFFNYVIYGNASNTYILALI